MEEFDINDGFERSDKDEIFSKSVRAGKRTYFFDVKATRKNDYYLTLTESKKRFEEDGRFYFEKHKIFLYQEDFEKFVEGLQQAISFVNNLQTSNFKPTSNGGEIVAPVNYANVEFEDLVKKID